MNKLPKFLAFLSLILFLTLASCVTPKIEKAFFGKMEAEKADEIISEYCSSCHVHKTFDAEAHVFDVKYRYENPKYAGNTKCNVCHTYSKSLMFDIRRGTHWPKEL